LTKPVDVVFVEDVIEEQNDTFCASSPDEVNNEFLSESLSRELAEVDESGVTDEAEFYYVGDQPIENLLKNVESSGGGGGGR
jgi:hypothetical protein